MKFKLILAAPLAALLFALTTVAQTAPRPEDRPDGDVQAPSAVAEPIGFQQPKSDAPLIPNVVGPSQFQRGVKAAQDAPVKSDAGLVGALGAEQKAEHAKKFPRGLKGPTPPAKMQSVPKFQATVAAPTQAAYVPANKHYWGNNKYGNCVPVASIASLAAWTTFCGQPVIATDAEAIEFSRKHGWLNGTWATEVMDVMQSEGVTIGGKVYKEGPYASVDYNNVAALQAALTVGPQMIAIDADALPSSAGNRDGWYVTGNTHSPNTDHEVVILGFGPAKWLYEQIHTPLPAGLSPDTQGFLVFTWSTIGFVDHPWIKGTVVECFVRNPTTVGFSPTPTPPDPGPGPGPGPGPTPTPAPGGFTGTVTYTYVNGAVTAVAVTPGPAPTPPAPPPPKDGEELVEAAKVGYEAFTERLGKVKFCPEAILLGFKLYADLQAKPVDPLLIAADVAAINAAIQNCRKQGAAVPYPAAPCSTGALLTAPAACEGVSCGASAPTYRFAPFGGRFRR